MHWLKALVHREPAQLCNIKLARGVPGRGRGVAYVNIRPDTIRLVRL